VDGREGATVTKQLAALTQGEMMIMTTIARSEGMQFLARPEFP
jgi:hypothetical protein